MQPPVVGIIEAGAQDSKKVRKRWVYESKGRTCVNDWALSLWSAFFSSNSVIWGLRFPSYPISLRQRASRSHGLLVCVEHFNVLEYCICRTKHLRVFVAALGRRRECKGIIHKAGQEFTHQTPALCNILTRLVLQLKFAQDEMGRVRLATTTPFETLSN